MDLNLLFDHRFRRDRSGRIYSVKGYSHAFFVRRYLGTFDRVRLLARVASDPEEIGRDVAPTEGEGVEVVSLGDWNGPAGFLARRPAVSRALRAGLRRPGAVIALAPGVVGMLSYRAISAIGRPYAVEVVGDPYDTFAPGAVRHPLRPLLRSYFRGHLRRQCELAAAAIYVTNEALQRNYPCPAHSVGASDVDLPGAAFLAAARQVRRPGGPTRLIMVGTLAQLYKAPDVLLEAVAVGVRGGLDLHLTFIGDGKHRVELETRAGILGLGDRVEFAGQVSPGDGVRARLDAADLFVLPSRQEGLPRAMVEAMARALPCIGSTVGGIPELLPGEDLVPPNDVGALAAKIREVVEDPGRMARMSARNLEKAREYREDVLLERRIAFYRYVREMTEAWIAARGTVHESPLFGTPL